MNDGLEISLAFLKIIAVIVTGAFGVLALVVEYRDKRTHRLTKWGKVALVGVIASAAIATISQSMEVVLAQRSARGSQAKYTETLRQFTRVLMPLRPERIELSLNLPDGAYVIGDVGRVHLLGKALTVANLVTSLAAQLCIAKRAPQRTAVNQSANACSGPFVFLVLGNDSRTLNSINQDTAGHAAITFTSEVNRSHIWNAGQEIRSIPDLPDAYLQLNLYNANPNPELSTEEARQVLSLLKPSNLVVRFDSVQIAIPNDELVKRDSASVMAQYEYKFPSNLDEILRNMR